MSIFFPSPPLAVVSLAIFFARSLTAAIIAQEGKGQTSQRREVKNLVDYSSQSQKNFQSHFFSCCCYDIFDKVCLLHSLIETDREKERLAAK